LLQTRRFRIRAVVAGRVTAIVAAAHFARLVHDHVRGRNGREAVEERRKAEQDGEPRAMETPH
jgi:hypothetical protein